MTTMTTPECLTDLIDSAKADQNKTVRYNVSGHKIAVMLRDGEGWNWVKGFGSEQQRRNPEAIGLIRVEWHSPAGYGEDPLCCTGTFLQPTNDMRVNVLQVVLTDDERDAYEALDARMTALGLARWVF